MTWNVRGLNDPIKGREVRKWILNKQVQIAGILETKIRRGNTQAVVTPWLPVGWDYLANDTSTNGRILVIWNTLQVSVDLIWMDD